jgi:hypothetical protein
MIFVAVSMGFIAENIREQLTEKQLSRDYLESYHQELVLNKAEIKNYDSSYSALIPKADSLVYQFYNKRENLDLVTMARLTNQSKFIIIPILQNSAYKQIINSGGLRYIKNNALKDSMTVYEGLILKNQNYVVQLNAIRAPIFAQVAALEDFHNLFGPGKLPAMQPYPELTERERRTLISWYKLSVAQWNSSKINLKRIKELNEVLLQITKNEMTR